MQRQRAGCSGEDGAGLAHSLGGARFSAHIRREPDLAKQVATAHHSTETIMGSIGTTEIILIFLAVLLLFGAKRIPEIARGLGKGIREFKDASNDIKRELTITDAPPQQIQQPAQQPTPTVPPVQQQAPAPVEIPPQEAPPAEGGA